jgi:hypothetical protein
MAGEPQEYRKFNKVAEAFVFNSLGGLDFYRVF